MKLDWPGDVAVVPLLLILSRTNGTLAVNRWGARGLHFIQKMTTEEEDTSGLNAPSSKVFRLVIWENASAATAATIVGGGRNINRRRSAVYGANTGLSIGAVM